MERSEGSAAITSVSVGLRRSKARRCARVSATSWSEITGLDGRVFGEAAAGWALAGICPGTVFTQLGEGKLSAFFPLIGLFAGVWAFLRFGPKFKK